MVIKHAESNVNAKAVFLGEKFGYWCVCVCFSPIASI